MIDCENKYQMCGEQRKSMGTGCWVGTVESYNIESGQRKPPWEGNRGPERSKEAMKLWRTEGSSRPRDSVHKTLKVKWAWWVWGQNDCVAGRKNEKWSERRGRGQSIVLWTWGHCTIPRAVWEDRPLEALGQLSNDHSGCCVEMRVEGAGMEAGRRWVRNDCQDPDEKIWLGFWW